MSIKNQLNNSKQPKKNQQDKLDKELQETFGNRNLNDFRRTLEKTSNQRRKSSFLMPILIILIILAMLYFIFFN